MNLDDLDFDCSRTLHPSADGSDFHQDAYVRRTEDDEFESICELCDHYPAWWVA